MSIRGERRLRHRRIRLALAAAVMAGIISGCGSWQYTDLVLPDALRDVRTESQGDVSVSVAILDDDRAAAHFGVDLGASDIQAIWIRVRNASDVKLWFLRAVLDPDFYPADEVAMIVRRSVPGKSFPEFQQRLRDESMHLQIQPRTVTQGFVFAPRAIGGRYVDVRLVQDAIQAEARRERAAGAGERPLRQSRPGVPLRLRAAAARRHLRLRTAGSGQHLSGNGAAGILTRRRCAPVSPHCPAVPWVRTTSHREIR
jgi:hypothetical protein